MSPVTGRASARGCPPGPVVLLATLVVLGAPGARAQAPPPLNISAANVTGSRGPAGDIVLLNGDVRIVRGRTVITADNGRYLRTQGMLYLDQRVHMVDSLTTLTCDHASYSEDRDVLEVSGHVVLTDRDATLRAPSGTYDRAAGRTDLFQGVEAEDSTQKIVCDRLAYLRESQLVQARGRVRGVDKESRLELRADSVDYDRAAHQALALGDPVMESRDADGRTSLIRALRLRLDTESRIARAVDSVRISRDTLQARADSAWFDDRADRGWLFGHPRAWDNETTVTGDTLEIWTEQRKLRRFVVRGDAVMDYRGAQPATSGETNRLVGRQVDVFFTNEDIDSLVATGGARNDYQAIPRGSKTSEKSRAEGDTITVFFDRRKIERALVRGHARGEYHFAVEVGDTAAARSEVVQYDAPRIEYQVSRDRIVLDPGAHLIYKELELRAKRVEFDSERQTLMASGEPQLVDRGDKVTGHLMTYDLESRTGTIYQAETAYERGLYHGEQIRKVDNDVLDVKRGSYSTCDLPEPHYHFQARWMKIFLKDKLVAKPVVFYVKNVPLLALPFWVFPIKPGRHSGFLFPQFEFGFNNRAGQFVRNAGYYWATNDYMDLTLTGDYYQTEPSWKIFGEANYKLLYAFDGHLAGKFARDERDGTDNYDFNADHRQEFSPRTNLSAQASFVSSRDFRRSALFGNPLSQRIDRFLVSSLSLTHNADWASLSAQMVRREDLDADESIKDPDGFGPLLGPPPVDVFGRPTVASLPSLTQSLPSLTVAFPTRTIGGIGWLKGTPLEKPLSSMYFSLNAQFISLHERRGFVTGFQYDTTGGTLDSTTVVGERRLSRRAANANVSLTDSRRLFGWLNIAPAFGAEGAIYDFDNLGNTVVPAGTWNSSLSASATFYRTSRVHLGPVVGMRHVVFPRVSLVYSPEFPQLTFVDDQGARQERFASVGGIFLSGFKSARMSFGLDQRLQMKLKRGSQVERLDNLLSWGLSGSYNFLYREQNLRRPLSNLSSSLRLQPPGVFSANLGTVVDPYSQRPIRTLGYNLELSLAGRSGQAGSAPDLPLERRVLPTETDLSEPWSLGFAYSYAGGYSEGPDWSSAQTANGTVHFNLTHSTRLDYSASLDVTGRQLVTQRFGLTRDLHCWQASFTRAFSAGGEAEYYFRLGIREQREIYIERGSRIGSIGGIQ
ncbi:MAG TPA: putative LPS assembly protein LptD [Candidatus Eisenbacteria bacterium]